MDRIGNMATALFIIGIMAASAVPAIVSTAIGKEVAELTFVDSSNGLPSKGQWRESIAFYDVNDDGYMDIVAPPPRLAEKGEDAPAIWYGDAKGKWTLSRPQLPPDSHFFYGGVTVADFDGDAIPDIGLAMHGLGMKVLKGKGNNHYEDFSNGLPPGKDFPSRALVSADFDHDGKAEIVAISEGKFSAAFPVPIGLRICSYDNQTWTCNRVGEESESQGLFADKLVVGDVNGDGHKDIAVATLAHVKCLIIWTGDGKGGFQAFNKGLPQERHYPSVALADINGDGKDDLVASITGIGINAFSGVRAFLSGSDGFKEISEGLPVNEAFAALAAGDLDGDGSVEVVAGVDGLKIFSYRKGRWQHMNAFGLPEKGLKNIRNIYLLDVNKDGYKDIALNYSYGENNNGGIRVFLFQAGRAEDENKKNLN